MINHSNETDKISRMKTVLSEMIATTSTELEQGVFNIRDIEERLEVDTASLPKVPADTHTDYSNSTSIAIQTPVAALDDSLELVSPVHLEATQSTTQEIECGDKETSKYGNVSSSGRMVLMVIGTFHGAQALLIYSPALLCLHCLFAFHKFTYNFQFQQQIPYVVFFQLSIGVFLNFHH